MTLLTRTGSLLCLAALLGAFCSCTRHDASDAPPASGTAAAPAQAAASSSGGSVTAWLPGDRPVAGWTRAKAPETFGPDGLWESIDGAAETYLAFGFQELVTESCRQPDLGAEATVEVYRMSDALGAYGIYAQERNPKGEFTAVGAEGYGIANVFNFWNGPYYVKLTAGSASDAVASSLRQLATEISRRIGAPSPLPAALHRLPAAGQLPHSLKYIPRDVLGQSYLTNGVEAAYGDAKTPWRLVAVSLETPEAAGDALARYKTFLALSARVGRAPDMPGEGGFVAEDRFYGSIVALRSGRTVAVALGAPSERQALDLITALLGTSE